MPDTAPASPTSRSRRPFFWVLALFFAPLLLAFAIYYGFSWRPGGMTNKGELISPVIPLPASALTAPDGQTLATQLLHGKWTLIYVGSGACTQLCRDTLVVMRQVRLLLGKDMTRVQRVFLYSDSCCDAEYFAHEQSGLVLASLDNEVGQDVLKLFPMYAGVPVLDAQRLYIVDPLGNLMMSYAAQVDARDVLADLKKLLSLSHIG